MVEKSRLLNVVDDDGNVLTQDTWESIHTKGLLHQEIHVWFYTPNKEIIFQLRGLQAHTYPNLLDATVGGHVEIGQDYEDAAIMEVREETGLQIQKSDLTEVALMRRVALPIR